MDAVFKSAYTYGEPFQKCLRCNMFVDANGQPDQKRYTAEQYFKFMAIPKDQRCNHCCLKVAYKFNCECATKEDFARRLLQELKKLFDTEFDAT